MNPTNIATDLLGQWVLVVESDYTIVNKAALWTRNLHLGVVRAAWTDDKGALCLATAGGDGDRCGRFSLHGHGTGSLTTFRLAFDSRIDVWPLPEAPSKALLAETGGYAWYLCSRCGVAACEPACSRYDRDAHAESDDSGYRVLVEIDKNGRRSASLR